MITILASFQNTLRRRLYPALDRFQSKNGLGYSAYALSEEEYICTLQKDVQEARHTLSTLGFAPEPIAALKSLQDGSVSRGSWAKRESFFAPKQLHVHIFENGNGSVDLYGHYEWSYRPTPSDPMRWKRHYRPPEGSYDPAEGQRRTLTLLDENQIGYVRR